MTISSGYFNSVDKDRLYNADDMSSYFSGILSKGVLQNYLGSFQVVSNNSMTVSLRPGKAYFSDGKWILSDSIINFTLNTSDVTLKRIDRIVLRKDKSNSVRDCSIIVKTGTPSTAPVAPSLENDDFVEEMSVAAIFINNLVTTITNINITDERPYNDVCGFVHGLVNQIDTGELFTQYDEAFANSLSEKESNFDESLEQNNSDFNTWFSTVKDEVQSTNLVRLYTSYYTTSEDGETVIPINISQYVSALDILNVYVNGFKLIRNIDFTQAENDNEKITLVRALNENQTVEIEVYKCVAN